MVESLPVSIADPVPGPEPGAMLAWLSREHRDITLLHSAAAESVSVIGYEPLAVVKPGSGGLLDAMERGISAVTFEPPHPVVGWLGFISYDIARTLESIGECARDDMHWPLFRWTLYRRYLLHNPVRGEWTAVGIGEDAQPPRDVPAIIAPEVGRGRIVDAISAEAYRAKVQRVKEYIAAGDIYQANLAQRWSVETSDSLVEIYRRLCQFSPAPYAGFSRFVSDDGVERTFISASPELFLSVSEGRVLTRPIKGTRRRDADPARDESLRAELVASEKDKAELAMIVDLMRNDLGRVSEFGSVSVDAAREVEKHPTVWHTVASVTSRLKENAGLADLLRAVCPGGSITGAPKIRAMQIIEELEGFRRGLYCGNIGVIGPGGRTMTLNIAIRTILMQENIARVFAGGGIVADSDAVAEYEETVVKASAMLRALGVERL
jgi:anthranilate/para-aminobenzoate synthase component I